MQHTDEAQILVRERCGKPGQALPQRSFLAFTLGLTRLLTHTRARVMPHLRPSRLPRHGRPHVFAADVREGFSYARDQRAEGAMRRSRPCVCARLRR